jgi:hypothetical protein
MLSHCPLPRKAGEAGLVSRMRVTAWAWAAAGTNSSVGRQSPKVRNLPTPPTCGPASGLRRQAGEPRYFLRRSVKSAFFADSRSRPMLRNAAENSTAVSANSRPLNFTLSLRMDSTIRSASLKMLSGAK